MASKTTAKSTRTQKTAARTTSKTAVTKRKPAAKRAAAKRAVSTSHTVDYYPNRVAFLTAVSAVVILMSFAIASVLLLKY